MNIYRSKLMMTAVSMAAVGYGVTYLHDWNQREIASLDSCLRVYGLSEQLLVTRVGRSRDFALVTSESMGRSTLKPVVDMNAIENILRRQSRLSVVRTSDAIHAYEGDFGVEIALADNGLQVRCTE